jgi:membrane-associated phospholipid phosphatase
MRKPRLSLIMACAPALAIFSFNAAPLRAEEAAKAASSAAPAAPAKKSTTRSRKHETDAPPSAFNPRSNRVVWDDRWARFRTSEYVATGLLGATVFIAGAIPTSPDRWRDMGAFDANARSGLRLGSKNARDAASDASDLVLTLMFNQLVIDATLVAWWGHDRPSVGYQMVLIDLEAMAFTGAVQSIVAGLASRWRPYRDTCVGPLSKQTDDCRDSKQFRSFFSGHTSGAFTAAGLMCMHHAHIPLYGGGMPDVLACATSFAAAATVGALRVVSDRHFLSDALVGAAFGTLSGLGIPWLLHYRTGDAATQAGSAAKRPDHGISMRIGPAPMGIAASGEF